MATDSTDLAGIRRELDSLGRRRRALDARDEELSREVTDALRRAYGHIPVSEAARRLGVHRTTVYRVYRPHAV